MSTHVQHLLDEDPATVIAQHPDQIQSAIERAEDAGREKWAYALRKAYDAATEGSDGE